MATRPVGFSRDVPPKRVMHAQVDGQSLVVWRAGDGTIAAWDDRCPHRGMALSHGFVRGNALACLYHGWHYGTSGKCQYMPAHPDLDPPETIRATAFDVVEQAGVIWVSLSGAVSPDEVAPETEPLRSLIVEAPPDAIFDACATTSMGGVRPRAVTKNRFDLDDSRITVLLNPLDDRRTQALFLVDDATDKSTRPALSRWIEALRRRAETQQETLA